MAYIKKSDVLSDVVQRHVAIVPMLNRFGIRLGLGAATIEEVCSARGIDVAFFIHVLNSYLQPDYLSDLQFSPQHIVLLANYLEQTNASYLHAQVPNVEVHLQSFVKRSSQDNPAIQSVPHVLEELRQSLEERVRHDEEVLLPRFRHLASELQGRVEEVALEHKNLRVGHEKEEDRAEALVSDVMQVLIRHISGEFNDNLLYGLLYSLLTLKNDLASNNRLRHRVFLPMLEAMEQAVKHKPKS